MLCFTNQRLNKVSTTSNSSLDILREDVSELKVPFDKVRDTIGSELTKGSERLEATEKLYQVAADMTKRLGNRHENASNEQKEWKDVKAKLVKTSLKERVTLNVGGERYTTSINTLTHENNTYFTELFSEDSKHEVDDSDKSIFIDRNGETFAYILEYLRTDTVPDDALSDEIRRHNLTIEAEYFRLHTLIKTLGVFVGGTLLSTTFGWTLNEFYGKQGQRWELIYKASRDGFDANAFHTRCNSKGPTMTIIQSNNNYLFGGYTAIAWTSDGTYKNDTTAFLFTLTNPHSIPPTKYVVDPGSVPHAVYHHSSYGPTFGSGHALYLANNSNSSNSSINFPGGYIDTTGKGSSTFTGANSFLTSDIEVFKLV